MTVLIICKLHYMFFEIVLVWYQHWLDDLSISQRALNTTKEKVNETVKGAKTFSRKCTQRAGKICTPSYHVAGIKRCPISQFLLAIKNLKKLKNTRLCSVTFFYVQHSEANYTNLTAISPVRTISLTAACKWLSCDSSSFHTINVKRD